MEQPVWHPAASCPVRISRNDRFCMFSTCRCVLRPIYMFYVPFNPRHKKFIFQRGNRIFRERAEALHRNPLTLVVYSWQSN